MTPLLLAVCDPEVIFPAPSAVNWPTAAPTTYPKTPFMVASEHADAGTAIAAAKSRTIKLILRKFIDFSPTRGLLGGSFSRLRSGRTRQRHDREAAEQQYSVPAATAPSS